MAVVKRKQKIYLERADACFKFWRVRLVWRCDRYAVSSGQASDAFKPDQFIGVIKVRDHQRHLNAVFE
jgi:hypothetical protein